jgi:hypothetical protein
VSARTPDGEYLALGASFVEADAALPEPGGRDRAARIALTVLGAIAAVALVAGLILGIVLIAFAVFFHTLPGDPL